MRLRQPNLEIVRKAGRANVAALAVLVALSIYFALQVLSPTTRAPPALWGLWTSADIPQADYGQAVTFLRLSIVAHGCDGPAVVTRDVTYHAVKDFELQSFPTRFAMAVEGVAVKDLHVSLLDTRETTTALPTAQGKTVFVSEVFGGWTPGRKLEFVFHTGVAEGAGYEACYLTSPELFQYGADHAAS